MKKVIIKLNFHSDKDRGKVMKEISTIEGISSIDVSLAEGTVTVVGNVDPFLIVKKLRKQWCALLLSVGPTAEAALLEEERIIKLGASIKANQDQAAFKATYQAAKDNQVAYQGVLDDQAVLDQNRPIYHRHAYHQGAYEPPYWTQYNGSYAYSVEENPNACNIM